MNDPVPQATPGKTWQRRRFRGDAPVLESGAEDLVGVPQQTEDHEASESHRGAQDGPVSDVAPTSRGVNAVPLVAHCGRREASVSEGLKTRFTLGVLTCQGDVRIEDHGRNHLRPHGCRPHVVGVVVHRERRPLSREVRVARSMPTKPELGSNNNEFEVLYLRKGTKVFPSRCGPNE